jgi:hypothetical protein
MANADGYTECLMINSTSKLDKNGFTIRFIDRCASIRKLPANITGDRSTHGLRGHHPIIDLPGATNADGA